jgi:hypothetical protein
MILRRVIKHFRNQEWTAIAIDFVIVVFGVFVGIQVANWNDMRSDRQDASEYMSRLHDDVVNLIETRRWLVESRVEQLERPREAVALIIGGDGDVLTDPQCLALAFNQSVSNPTDDIGTLNELQSSGRLSILENVKVRAGLQDYLLARARSRDSQRQISLVVEPLLRAYPQLITVKSATEASLDNITQGSFTCDLEAMQNDDAFKNDLELAYSHFGFHVRDNARISESLATILGVLNQARSNQLEVGSPL